jgi:tetratricopeptide (TPR) repeat protein
MIRIVLALLLVVSVFVALVLFPDIASQPVRIEMLGWLFETRTGMFVLLVMTGLGVLWLLQKTFDVSVNSPKQLWTSLRSGSKKRRELRLQEAMTVWIDKGAGNAQKLLKRSKGIVPDWLHTALIVLWDKPSNQPKIDDEKDSPLIMALKARLATDDEHVSHLSLSERQHYLDVWLAAHPAAPLALQRKAILLGDMGEYAEQVKLLEELIQKNKNIDWLKPQLAQALYHLAEKEPEHQLAHLRKANRLTPDDTKILLSLASALEKSGDTKNAERLLLEHLQQHDDITLAQAALKLLSFDALKNFKRVDKPTFQNTYAGRWLRMMLAHEADLVGIAKDALDAMLEQNPTSLLWQTKGNWLAAEHAWEEATRCYQKAMSN